MYEDDGDYYDYEQGNYRRRTFTLTGASSSLTLEQRTEGRYNADYDTFRIIFHGLHFLPAGMVVDGETQMFESHTMGMESFFSVEVDKSFEHLKIMRLDGFA